MVAFTPYSPGWLTDPYAEYRALRAEEPVHWSDELRHWVLTRHADVELVLKDERFSAANRPPQRRWGTPTTMVTADPPDHARLRRPTTRRFTTDAIDAMRPRVQEVVDALLAEVATAGRMDVVADLARPLPRTIISELLGVHHAGAPAQRAAQDDPHGGARREGGMGASMSVPGEDYFQQAIERHRAEVEDDLLQDLLRAEAGREMSPEEVLDSAMILYGAGQETTAKLIASGVYHLLRRPELAARLRTDPTLAVAATEELLRYDPPVQAVSRRALEDVELGGRAVRKGEKLLCVLGAANRDPDVFDHPDELDFDRGENPHVTFGTGRHVCLGAGLARAEIQSALGTLFRRYPGLALETDDVVWEGSLILRGLSALPVTL